MELQDWMLRTETWLTGMAGEWRGTKSTVIDETAALAAQLDRIEKKVDEALAEIRALKQR
jgi:hypothetical protein